jgi:hypothetical protein
MRRRRAHPLLVDLHDQLERTLWATNPSTMRSGTDLTSLRLRSVCEQIWLQRPRWQFRKLRTERFWDLGRLGNSVHPEARRSERAPDEGSFRG